MSRIDDYRRWRRPGAVDIILRLAEQRRGPAVPPRDAADGSAAASAEILRAGVPILSELGIDARWEITGGDPAYYATARALQAALEGAERVLDRRGARALGSTMNRLNAKKLDLDADLRLVHDVQPASLVTPGRGPMGLAVPLRLLAPAAAGLVLLPAVRRPVRRARSSRCRGSRRRLGIPMYVIPPSIDPLSDKNRDLAPREVAEILAALGVARDKPLLVQVGPFARAQDPLGVVNAYRLVKKHHDVRLVLAGTAGDEPERLEILAELREAAQRRSRRRRAASCRPRRIGRSTRCSAPPRSCSRSRSREVRARRRPRRCGRASPSSAATRAGWRSRSSPT